MDGEEAGRSKMEDNSTTEQAKLSALEPNLGQIGDSNWDLNPDPPTSP